MYFKLLEIQEAKPQIKRRKEIIKIKTEINEIGTKKTYKRSMKPKVGPLTR
jgi:hypothetical protein